MYTLELSLYAGVPHEVTLAMKRGSLAITCGYKFVMHG